MNYGRWKRESRRLQEEYQDAVWKPRSAAYIQTMIDMLPPEGGIIRVAPGIVQTSSTIRIPNGTSLIADSVHLQQIDRED